MALIRILLCSAALGVGLSACGDDGPPPTTAPPDPQAALEIVGAWASNFGSEEIITRTSFNGSTIVAYDNVDNVLITQSPDDAEFNPGLFNRIVWLEPTGDRFYYCFVAFGLPTQAAAESSTEAADGSDPDNGGCGGFPWTRLRRAVSIRGTYLSNFGGMETITATAWRQSSEPMAIADWDDDAGWVITQNADDAMFGPSSFNRIEFTPPDTDGSFFYCFVDFGLDTLAAARTSTRTADAAAPETSGCGGFSWTRLDPA